MSEDADYVAANRRMSLPELRQHIEATLYLAKKADERGEVDCNARWTYYHGKIDAYTWILELLKVTN